MKSKNTPESGKTVARRERDREFLTCYNRALELAMEQNVAHPHRLAVRWAIHNSAPHYHVSFDRAYKVVARLLRQESSTPIRESLQLEMWREIAQRVRDLVNGGPMSVARALEFVLEHGRASRFYVSERYAYETLVPRAKRERGQRLTTTKTFTKP